MTDTIGSRLRQALAAASMSQSDLVRLTGMDKNAVSAIANDRSRPRPATIEKIETALGLTPGTLEGSGEDPPTAPSASAVELSDEELVAELGYRLTRLKRENEELRAHRAASVTPMVREEAELAARRPGSPSRGKASQAFNDRLGEESQDPGGMDPA